MQHGCKANAVRYRRARRRCWPGVSKLAAAVKVTLGPTGRNVVLQKSFGAPEVTKDGVTVSKEIELPDPFENMGAKMVNEVASKTTDVAGDGTTTATVLAEAIYAEGLQDRHRRGQPDGASSAASTLAVGGRGRDHQGAGQARSRARTTSRKVATISANGTPRSAS